MKHPAATDSADRLEEKLSAIVGHRLIRAESMAKHVSMGVGGSARWFVVVDDEGALSQILSLAHADRVPWFLLSGGSNTIFSDAGFDGIVIELGRAFRTLAQGPGPHQVTAGASAPLSAVMNFAKRQALAGLEFAGGIPGTLGGALAGNAGAGPGEICPLVDSVDLLDPQGHPRTLLRNEFHYSYRSSELKSDVIIRATLGLAPDMSIAIGERINLALAQRMEQPIGVRCSGCIFKNPPGGSAGRLIDEAGLKGLAVGGASVSQQHANFIVNERSASAADIVALIGLIRSRLQERWGIELELEICIVGLDSSGRLH
jgi:UDP-N-acetylmuramate dehydrogenase